MLVLPERERTKQRSDGRGNQGRDLQNSAGPAQHDQRGDPGNGKHHEFIFQHHVEDRGQLASLRQQAEDEIAVVLKQRQKLYRYEPDSPQISALTEKLRQLRHTAKLCRNIETHSVEMEQRLLAAQEEDCQRQEREEKKQERKTKDGPRR